MAKTDATPVPAVPPYPVYAVEHPRVLCYKLSEGNAMKSHEDITVIPAPKKLRRLTGEFILSSQTKILTEPENEALAAIGTTLAGKLNAATGYEFVSDTSSQPEAPKGTIFLTTKGQFESDNDEAYSIEVLPRAITIEASSSIGIAHAVQTLRQLFPPEIESDKPVELPYELIKYD